MMRKPDMRTVKTTTAVSVAVLAMLAVPANAAMASDFQQDERDYTAAVSRSITLTSELKTGADEAKAKTVNAKDDDAATRLARESLRSRIAKAADVHAVSKEKATVFNVSSLTDQAVSSGRTAKSLSSSIDDGVRKVDDAVAAHRLRDARKNLETAAENGRKTLESSNGKVDDDNNRGQLSDVLNKTKATAASADADAIGRTAKTLNDLIAKVNADVQSRADREARQAAQAQRVQTVQQAAAYSHSASRSTGYSYAASPAASGSARPGYSTSASCALDSAADHCQGAVDGGGLVDMSYSGGHIYAQHNGTGGAWINGLQAGQTFTMNGSTYRVNGQSIEGAQYAPGSGDWMQTCDGNGNHLVGVTKIN
ncbi:hypothetical protein [Bifidobacterium adolescentis]|uniref:hypothetical protein n=1 Tax=Bifidobacterium adolescentis TaxID=1680 RepID=UPI003D7A01DF